MPRFTTTTQISWRIKVGTEKRSTTTERPSSKSHMGVTVVLFRPCISLTPLRYGGLISSSRQWTSLWKWYRPWILSHGSVFKSVISVVIPPCFYLNACKSFTATHCKMKWCSVEHTHTHTPTGKPKLVVKNILISSQDIYSSELSPL